MCSFIVTSLVDKDLDYINYYTKFRGPDYTNVFEREGITFIHNLLHMTGEFTIQPFIDDDIVCVFNGEIYNYKSFGDFSTDGKCLIPLYKEYGPAFVKELDGEFSVCLFDFSKAVIVISTDVFRTKPLWITIEKGEFGVASYKSALERLGFKAITRIPANTYVVFNKAFTQLENNTIYDFDLSKTKNSYDDWTEAFQESIRKRYEDSTQNVFLGLSSGYDSGAIACELNNQKVDYHAYSTIGRESLDILKQRHALIPNNSKGFIIRGTTKDYSKAHKKIEDDVEELKYEIYSATSNYNEFHLSLKDDDGANGLSYICSLAKKNGRRIYISGQGSDEIFADYGFGGVKKFPHSNFGGLFPDDLTKVFPWPSFYGSSQLSYLMKEEHISGAYGLEGRYPYLDKRVVQEFLWLSPKLKNSNYKSVLYNYLKENNYPFQENAKIGFSLL